MSLTELLVIHHSPTGSVERLLEAALRGARHPELRDVALTEVPALAWARGEQDASIILRAHAYLFITPANFGYMSGALKHVFDSTFMQVGGALGDDGSAGGSGGALQGRPYGLIVHGRYDTTGAVRSVQGVVGALGLKPAFETLEALGDVTDEHLAAAEELGANLAANLTSG